jgi:intracellular multiplication protein IcmC
MLPRAFQNKYASSAIRFLGIIFLFFFVVPIYAQVTPNIPPLDTPGGLTTLSAQNMIIEFAKSIPNLMRLVTSFAYVFGMVLIIRGIIKFKHFGESRTMMSEEHSIIVPITYIAVGASLIYLPSAVNVGMSTFWNEPNPYGYIEYTDQWGSFIRICFLVVQLVGTIAFIRGLILMSHAGGRHGQQGAFKQGLTHIIGGILCINIYQFVQVILATFGLPTLS